MTKNGEVAQRLFVHETPSAEAGRRRKQRSRCRLEPHEENTAADEMAGLVNRDEHEVFLSVYSK